MCLVVDTSICTQCSEHKLATHMKEPEKDISLAKLCELVINLKNIKNPIILPNTIFTTGLIW